ncbi:MAG: hypothetical protein INF34_04810 [Roseomonas sp.]|jgi:hypothetical protein|nr:hypothetical protein [Roseomonas sp.]MCA3432431.1 hypothetical protein [Roseomonas sp.]
MSFAFNPPARFSLFRGNGRAAKACATKPHLEGLSISPESAGSRRADSLAGLVLFLLGLGFFAATTFFITALITITLG